MVTLKEIADLAGVSRGTVDRVLNNRGSVNPQTAEKIMDIVRALDYRPNKAGLALAAQKKKYKIGILLFSKNNPFFDEVMEGVESKSLELLDYGVTTVTRRIEFDVEAQLEAMEALVEEGIHGLVLAPCNDERIRSKINELSEKQIPVITVNTDIEGSNRLAYVGSNYFQGGCVAAGLFSLMTSGDVKLAILSGSSSVLCHTERIRGFRHTIEGSYPEIHVIEILENHDDEFESYSLTADLLKRHSDLDALFFTAGGVHGGCRAVQESGLRPRIITFDEVPTTLEMLKNGVVSATISQCPFHQGADSLNLLFEYLTTGIVPENQINYVECAIRIRENL